MAVKPARVLPLEEARNLKVGTDIFIDEKSYVIVYAATFKILIETPFSEWFNFFGDLQEPMDIKNYNKTYRFWNKRPTIKERMETKWKDGDSDAPMA